MQLKSFSFAETLAVILIIGIIATVAIPTLSTKFALESTRVAFANDFKSINKAFLNYSLTRKCNGKLACTDLFSDNNTAEKISSLILHAPINRNCWSGKKIANYNNSSDTTDLNELSCFIDASSTIYATDTISFDCSENLYNDNNIHKLQHSCGYLYVDINGIKAPNMFGKDVFIFVITDSPPSYLYPVGGSLWKDDMRFPNVKACAKNGEGRTCAGKIVEDGWKVTYFN